MEGRPEISRSEFWDERYRSGTIGWDLGGPTPVFERLAASKRFAPGKMIVLGAGRGHDARLFARHGFEVTAVDFSPLAAAEMARLTDDDAPVRILQQDIFNLTPQYDQSFDYLLEYTCFCALHPSRRKAYFDLVNNLLAPGGTYVALAFPFSWTSDGPPFVVAPEEIVNGLAGHGINLIHRERPSDSVKERRGLEELLVLRKPLLQMSS